MSHCQIVTYTYCVQLGDNFWYILFSKTRLFTELQEREPLQNSVIGGFAANYNKSLQFWLEDAKFVWMENSFKFLAFQKAEKVKENNNKSRRCFFRQNIISQEFAPALLTTINTKLFSWKNVLVNDITFFLRFDLSLMNIKSIFLLQSTYDYYKPT